MKYRPGAILFLSAIILFLNSCKDEYTLCSTSKTVSFIGGFYQKISGSDVSARVPNLNIYLLNTGSSAIYSNQQNAHTFSLPLNPQADSSRYVISISAAQSDTLTIVYSTQSISLSPECGSVFNNNITKVYTTAHSLDSAVLINAVINTNPLENAKIFF